MFITPTKKNYQNKYLIRQSASIKTKIFPSSNTVKIFLKELDEFISLDDVAFDIWQLLRQKILFEDLVKKLKNEYSVPEKKLEKDVVQFLAELEKYQLIKVSAN